MSTSDLTIPKKTIYDILKAQPEDVLMEIFEDIMINCDTSPLSDDEKKEIREAKQEYEAGNTIVLDI